MGRSQDILVWTMPRAVVIIFIGLILCVLTAVLCVLPHWTGYGWPFKCLDDYPHVASPYPMYLGNMPTAEYRQFQKRIRDYCAVGPDGQMYWLNKRMWRVFQTSSGEIVAVSIWGMLANAACVGVLAAAILSGPRLMRAARVRFLPSPGRCARCRYDLTGNVSGVCPECGTPIPEEERRNEST